MRKDDTLSRHRQEVVENVSFRQYQYAIRFIHEPRDLSQRTFSEVANFPRDDRERKFREEGGIRGRRRNAATGFIGL
jgi:hypothetical protein